MKSLFLESVFSFAVLTAVLSSSCSGEDKEDNVADEESVVGLWKSEYDAENSDGIYTVFDYLLFNEDETGAYVTISKYDTTVDLIFWKQKDTLVTISSAVDDEDFISDNAFIFKNGMLSLSWKEEDEIFTEEYERSDDDIQELIKSDSAK